MAQVKLLKIASDGVPLEFDSAADEITLLSGQFGNVLASGNTIVSTDTDGNLILTPNGTGDLVLDGVNWPQADGTVDQVLATDGAGQLSYVTPFASQMQNSYVAGEILADAEAVYISAADEVSLADASSGGVLSRLMGFCEGGAAAAAAANVISAGVLDGFTGMTAGDRMFLDSTPGAIVATRPTGAGNTVVQAGYAKSATELHIHIQQLGRVA